MITTATKVCKLLQDAGFEAVFAGGFVRDKVLNRPLGHDVDIATSATPDQVVSLCKSNHIQTKEVGKSFGVVLVRVDDFEFEIATFRTESDYTDGRHPDKVEFATMEEDAQRRDLTINAMFWDPVSDTLFDFVGGREDARNHLIRFVGSADERINEDKLRMLRAVRLAGKFNFKMDEVTVGAIQNHAHEITAISAERIQQELVKMFKTGEFVFCWNVMKGTHLLRHVLPEIDAMDDVPQSPKHHPEGDVGTHVRMVMDELSDESWILQLAALFHDVAKPVTISRDERGIHFFSHENVGADMTEKILKELKFSTDQIDYVCALVRDHMKIHTAVNMNKSTLRKLMAQSHFPDLLKLGWADTAASKKDYTDLIALRDRVVVLAQQELLPKPMITGKTLIDLGLKPGPAFKALLDQCFDKQLETGFENQDVAMEFLRSVM